MKQTLLAILAVSLLVAGCGANKKYVDAQVAAAEERSNSKLTAVSSKTDENAEQLARLQSLSSELSRKTDMALNQAAGFEKYQVIWQGEINFGFDQYDIDPEAQAILDEAGRQMTSRKQAIAEIAGYTDRIGSREYNYVLGERRANAVKRYLGDNFSVGMFRMFTVSYGKDKADQMPDQPQAGAKNRRVTVTLWAPPSTETAAAN
ncbi:MAG: OmpA family protein [candidate division Zixibacteria bacterium]|nr:OmpA family protein [candidate division Zixibacteria bacterium]